MPKAKLEAMPSRSPRVYFILAPREMSEARVRDLIRSLLQKSKGGRVIFGIAEEAYVLGHENQPQFRTLKPDYVNTLAKKASNSHTSPLQVLTYSQKDGVKVIRDLDFTHAIVINGSFARSFHLRPEYAALLAKDAKLKFLSPFLDENEAKQFAQVSIEELSEVTTENETALTRNDGLGERRVQDINLRELFGSEIEAALQELTDLLDIESAKSFDNSFQTAAILVKNNQIIAKAHNTVVPYATYAWHHGAQRERHLCDTGDSSHYDTCHAETAALMQAGPAAKGADLYCRTFPCPQCARNIVHAGVKSVSYQLDFNDPYSYTLLKAAGIKCQKKEDK
jgi:deoxycytidylate deaminase